MSTPTKHYRIRINDFPKSRNKWYSNKPGFEYEVTLGTNRSIDNNDDPVVVFVVQTGMYVFPIDCSILEEWISN